MKSLRLLFLIGLGLIAIAFTIPEMRADKAIRFTEPLQAQGKDEGQPDNAKQQFAVMKTHYDAGLQALAAKQYETAVTELSQASALGPTQPAVWANLGQAYADLAGTKPEADRKLIFSKAADAYGTAVNLTPGDVSILSNYAIALGWVGRFDEARAATEKAVNLDPTKAGLCYFNLGGLLYNSNQDDAALEAFEKVPPDSPEFAKAKEQIDNIRLGNPVFKSVAPAIQTAAFRSDIGVYLESARNRFQSLKGKELGRTNDFVASDSTLNLPGASCGIMTDLTGAKMTHLACTFSKSRNKDQLRSDYQQLLAAVRKSLPSAWSFRDLDPEPATGPSTMLTGPGIDGFVGTNWNGHSYELDFSLEVH